MKNTLKKLTLSVLAATALAAAAGEISVENAAGKQQVPQSPEKIVVMDFGAADSLRALGAADRITGFPQGGRVPAYLSEFQQAKFTNVGTLQEPAFEQINELAPDLIVLSPRQEKIRDKFAEIAPVFFAKNDYADYYPSFEQNILAFGKMLNQEALAKQKLAALNQKVDAVAQAAKGKTALLVLVNESKISVYGDNSRYALVYQKFGFTPADLDIKSSTHGMSVGFEYILDKNPDYLLVVDRTAAITDKTNNAQNVLNNAIIRQTQAHQNNRIVYLDAANWYLAFGGLQSMDMIADELLKAVKK